MVPTRVLSCPRLVCVAYTQVCGALTCEEEGGRVGYKRSVQRCGWKALLGCLWVEQAGVARGVLINTI